MVFFLGFALFLPPKEDFFSFDEGSPFENGRYWKVTSRWESLLSQMLDA